MPRRCPDCRGPLREELHRGVRLDVCADHGMWFDLGEVQRWSGRATPTNAPLATDAGDSRAASLGACPRCDGVVLMPRSFARTAVAACGRCRGVWLSRAAAAALASIEPRTTAESPGAGDPWWTAVAEGLFEVWFYL
jgi:Zn-finger nucleic acid-binding protein